MSASRKSPTSRCASIRRSSRSRRPGSLSCASGGTRPRSARRLDEVRRAAEGDANLLYPLREALRALATIGEVSDALRDVWGVYRPPEVY